MLLTNARLYYEAAQQQQSAAAMTTADNITFSLAAKPWSQAPGYEYAIMPYGLATGGTVTPAASAADDQVDVAALTAMMPGATGASATTGMLTVAASANLAVQRGATTNTHRITSITVTSSGTIAAVAGAAHTAFSETRGANGGPPYIPDGSVEVGQVRLTSTTAGPVSAEEISQIPGVSQERSAFPVVSTRDPLAGTVTFADALPAIHTGDIPKRVYARVATPVFADMGVVKDWVPAEASSSVSSDDYYTGPRNSVSSSVGQASFALVLEDGLTDAVLALDGKNVMFKFKPDADRAPYQLTQGIFRKTRAYPVGGEPTLSATISSASASMDFAS